MSATAGVTAALAGLALPVHASAHPLGNFTINRYDGVTVGADRAQVDHVLDMAEIPALQTRQKMDVDADGAVSESEGATWADATCRATAGDLSLSIQGAAVALNPTAVGLSFPMGQAGLVTLRLVCEYDSAYAPLTATSAVEFRDQTFADRLGWREIVIRGNGTVLNGAAEFATGSSDRLRAYPPAAVQAPRAQASAAFTAAPGGLPAPAAPTADAVALGSDAHLIMRGTAVVAAVPGAAELPVELTAIIQVQDLTLPAVLLSLAIAVFLGVLHAASPGHGKTLMAAYLVGSRGTARQAIGLGLTVTVAHTIGVFGLGVLVLFAGTLIPSERLFPILGLVSGLIVATFGAVLLAQRLRARRGQLAAHEHVHTNEADGAGWHAHGVVRHTHLPQRDNPLRWRNLVALGLIGGLVPSASAILILVGSIAAGRPAFGMVLTFAFGIGMAVVLVGVGLLLVRARSFVERLPTAARLTPLLAQLPLATAGIFLAVGVAITLQAGAQLR